MASRQSTSKMKNQKSKTVHSQTNLDTSKQDQNQTENQDWDQQNTQNPTTIMPGGSSED